MSEQESLQSSNSQISSSSEGLTLAVKIAFVALGMAAIITRMWVAEDAYITFRYIDNFLHGYGLVYNVGDRVEGFTHPLWLFLVTIPAALGVSIRASALVISLALSFVTLWLLVLGDRERIGS